MSWKDEERIVYRHRFHRFWALLGQFVFFGSGALVVIGIALILGGGFRAFGPAPVEPDVPRCEDAWASCEAELPEWFAELPSTEAIRKRSERSYQLKLRVNQRSLTEATPTLEERQAGVDPLERWDVIAKTTGIQPLWKDAWRGRLDGDPEAWLPEAEYDLPLPDTEWKPWAEARAAEWAKESARNYERAVWDAREEHLAVIRAERDARWDAYEGRAAAVVASNAALGLTMLALLLGAVAVLILLRARLLEPFAIIITRHTVLHGGERFLLDEASDEALESLLIRLGARGHLPPDLHALRTALEARRAAAKKGELPREQDRRALETLRS